MIGYVLHQASSIKSDRPPPSIRCTVPGCSDWGREGKPWCPDHVLSHSPYAIGVVARQADLGRELRQAAAGRTRGLEVSGLACTEMLDALQDGPRTLRRLARDLSWNYLAAGTVVGILHGAGKVMIGRSARGHTLVGLAC